MRTAAVTFLLGCSIAMTACRADPPDQQPTHAPGEAEATHAGADALVDREALALRPIMQRLAASMAGLSQSIWLEDFVGMGRHAEEIAAHAHIADDETQRIEGILGSEMAAFVEADEAVHEASVRLHDAVQARIMDSVLVRLTEVQAGCVSCHAQFRERLRSDRPPETAGAGR